ncbi:MAG: hypothetical protein U0360_10645 [Dehalococcoidia bacterium]
MITRFASPSEPRRAASGGQQLRDCILLALLIGVVAAPYLRLGYGLDDWDLLHRISTHDNKPFWRAYREFWHAEPWFRMRPLQSAYHLALYRTFGLDDDWPHLINLGVYVGGVIGAYGVLLNLGVTRRMALATCILFAVFPHFSTDRIWYSAHFITLSFACGAAAMYADLRALDVVSKKAFIGLKTLSILGISVSILLYEVTIPLLFLSGLALWWRSRLLDRGTRRALLSGGANAVLVLALVGFKAVTSTRTDAPNGIRELISRAVRLFGGAALNGYSRNLLELPDSAWRSLTQYGDVTAFIVAGIAGVMTFAYLVADGGTGRVSVRQTASYLAIGGAISIFSYAIFIVLPLPFVKAGSQNRIAIVATMGVALVVAAAILALSQSVARYTSLSANIFVATMTSLLVFGSVAVDVVVTRMAVEAYEKQVSIVSRVSSHMNGNLDGISILVDGSCQWIGPWPVFETFWDTTGSMRLLTGQRSVRADVVSPILEVHPDGVLMPAIPGMSDRFVDSRYGYEGLYLYRADTDSLTRLSSEEEARSYFQRESPNALSPCYGFLGLGTPIFPNLFWGTRL